MKAGKFPLLLHYHLDIQRINIPYSFLAGLAGYATGLNFFTSFIVSLVTGGYFLASYLFDRNRKHEYYFYYNKGFSRAGLIAYSWLLDGLLALLIATVKSIIR
ncbi:MAG: hypothetical protein JST42_06280 [Bacteroidetes bacterium]|nr:hypothetical protein [Bacteroidota bacterium]